MCACVLVVYFVQSRKWMLIALIPREWLDPAHLVREENAGEAHRDVHIPHLVLGLEAVPGIQGTIPTNLLEALIWKRTLKGTGGTLQLSS